MRNFLVLLGLTLLVSGFSACATPQQQNNRADFYITIYNPAQHIVGIPKQQITGHVAETYYNGTKIPTGSLIVGTYTNNGSACKITWQRINLINGNTINNQNLAYTPCKANEKFEIAELVSGYWH